MYDGEFGNIIFNIYDYITPNMLYLFKKKKEYMVFKNDLGQIVELHWPDNEELDFLKAEAAYNES